MSQCELRTCHAHLCWGQYDRTCGPSLLHATVKNHMPRSLQTIHFLSLLGFDDAFECQFASKTKTPCYSSALGPKGNHESLRQSNKSQGARKPSTFVTAMPVTKIRRGITSLLSWYASFVEQMATACRPWPTTSAARKTLPTLPVPAASGAGTSEGVKNLAPVLAKADCKHDVRRPDYTPDRLSSAWP